MLLPIFNLFSLFIPTVAFWTLIGLHLVYFFLLLFISHLMKFLMLKQRQQSLWICGQLTINITSSNSSHSLTQHNGTSIMINRSQVINIHGHESANKHHQTTASITSTSSRFYSVLLNDHPTTCSIILSNRCHLTIQTWHIFINPKSRRIFPIKMSSILLNRPLHVKKRNCYHLNAARKDVFTD